MVDRILLVGDSDIAFWPQDLLPNVDGGKSSSKDSPPIVTVMGYSGATLSEVAIQLQEFLADLAVSMRDKSETIVVVACAGENDIGNDIPLDTSLTSLKVFLDILYGTEL